MALVEPNTDATSTVVSDIERPTVVTPADETVAGWDDVLKQLKENQQAPAEEQTHQPFSLRRKVRSLFVLSLAIFLLTNAVLSFTNPFKFDPFKFAYKGWGWWLMKDLRQDQREHNVAILGSSIVCSAIAGCDANFLNRKLDMTQYHGGAYFDQLLQKRYGGNFNTFSLAAPGQMPSDAYLYLRAMTETANRPDVVIYGVAPRDFIDSTLQGPNDTEPFKYLSRVVNISNVANAEFRSPWAKLDWYLQQVIYTYGNSLDLRLAICESAEDVLNKAIYKPWSSTPFTWWHRIRMLPTYLPGDLHENAMVSAPLSPKDIVFIDNSTEYKARYKHPDRHTQKTQMYFLRKLAEYCHRERIELVLVNMPITLRNIQLMPDGVYSKYLRDMREFAWNHNVVMYDLCDLGKYSNADFHDTVHLNAFGGKKFFDQLIGKLSEDFRASTMLSIAGFELEKRNAIAMRRNTRSAKGTL